MSQRVQQQDEKEESKTTTDVTIPSKTVNTSLDLQERMTDNAWYAIGPARYFERNEAGEEIEDWNGVFDRVAANMADAEYEWGADETMRDSWKGRFESAMRELRFMPNSPTLMNAGLPLQQLSACIAGDSPVYTRDGLRTMASIEPGDEVLTHTGEFKEVTDHWSNGVKETISIHRGSSKSSHHDVTLTPDHELYNESGQWVEAESVSNAAQPTADPSVPFPQTLDLTQYTSIMSKEKPVTTVDGSVKVENSDDPRTGEYDQQYSEVTSHVVNDETMAWLGGVYLAEGDVDGSDLRFTIGAHEDEFRSLLIDRLSETFDTHVAVSESSAGEWVTITLSSPFVADLFRTVFGSGVDSKSVPEWAFAAGESYQQSMLDGILRGDGHQSETGWKLTMANPTLVYEASLLSRNLDYNVNFKFEAENELSSRRTSSCYISETERTSLENIVRTESEPVEVYDMEVAGDHSFVVGDFVAHNCFVVEPRDDMDNINQSQSDAAAIFKSGGGVGYAFHHLRAKGSRVASTGGVSSGPLSFMQLFDTTCDTVKQGGKRRGAQMGIMHVQHPDIGRFAVAKRGEDNLSNFNISMGITDDFIEAVRNDGTITLYDPTTRPSEQHDLRDGEPFDVVAEAAHFYDPHFEDAWNDDFDKPGVGLDGKPVDSNFWRDFEDEMTMDFSDIRQWFEDKADYEVRNADGGLIEVVNDEPAADDYDEQIAIEKQPALQPGEPLEVPAKFIWNMLIDGAHNNGEPGIFYLDETNRHHSFDVDENNEQRIHATNPCSEQPLAEYEACNLGHVNLSLMVDEKAPNFGEFSERYDKDPADLVEGYLNRALDHDTFEETIETGTRFLDNVVTQSEFPLDDITEQVGNKRKIGLGLMGFHQMLVQMGVEYGSDVSYEFAREIMRRIDKQATEYSHELAKVRGSFPEWEESKWSQPTRYEDWFETHAHKEPSEFAENGYLMRNHNVTTIAPTGTTSMIGNTTGGCEPLYQVAFLKNVGDDIQGEQNLVEFDDFFLRTLEANGINVEQVKEEVRQQMLDNEFSGADGLETVPDEIGELFVTTKDLSGEQHIRMQAAFQEYCDSGISKTLNLPFSATHEDVSDAFMLALESGIKGTTVYRSGSRKEEVKKENVDNYQEETLDSVADEELVQHLVDQRNLSVKAEHKLRQDLDVTADEEVERECPECDSGMLNLAEGCPVCMECGWSECA